VICGWICDKHHHMYRGWWWGKPSWDSGPRIISTPRMCISPRSFNFFEKVSSGYHCHHQWLGRFLGIIGWDPSVCKSNRWHVDIHRFFLIKLGYILQIPLKWSVIFLLSWTSTSYFSNSTGSSVTNCRFPWSLVITSAKRDILHWPHLRKLTRFSIL
jgi:hypothetical protein